MMDPRLTRISTSLLAILRREELRLGGASLTPIRELSELAIRIASYFLNEAAKAPETRQIAEEIFLASAAALAPTVDELELGVDCAILTARSHLKSLARHSTAAVWNTSAAPAAPEEIN